MTERKEYFCSKWLYISTPFLVSSRLNGWKSTSEFKGEVASTYVPLNRFLPGSSVAETIESSHSDRDSYWSDKIRRPPSNQYQQRSRDKCILSNDAKEKKRLHEAMILFTHERQCTDRWWTFEQCIEDILGDRRKFIRKQWACFYHFSCSNAQVVRDEPRGATVVWPSPVFCPLWTFSKECTDQRKRERSVTDVEERPWSLPSGRIYTTKNVHHAWTWHFPGGFLVWSKQQWPEAAKSMGKRTERIHPRSRSKLTYR